MLNKKAQTWIMIAATSLTAIPSSNPERAFMERCLTSYISKLAAFNPKSEEFRFTLSMLEHLAETARKIADSPVTA